MKKFIRPGICALLLFLVSCRDYSFAGKVTNVLLEYDTKPPVLTEVVSESEKVIRLVFNEAVRPFADSFEPFEAESDNCSIRIFLNETLVPGKSHTITGRVEDTSGNTAEVSVNAWGYNPNRARLRINEFTTKGTEANPDRTELKATSSGSVAGYALYAGVPSDYDAMTVLPDKTVNKGDFIVIWWTLELPSKISEHPSADVWNICAQTEKNLSSNNGAVVLTVSPAEGSEVEDAVLYCSFTSTQYEGWGTKTAYSRAKWVKDANAWQSEAFNSANSTATRSVSRIAGKEDTDGNTDWFITATSGATFGSENTSQRFD